MAHNEPTIEVEASSIDQLQEEIAQIRDELDEARAERDELREENEALREENAELRERVEELEDTQEDHGMRLDGMSNWIETVEDDVVELSDDVDELEANGTSAQSNPSQDTDDYEDYTTVEKYAMMPGSEREEILSASERRAVTVWENFPEWSDKVPAGRVKKTAELRNLIEAACDESLESKQVLRAADALERLSEGKIVLDQSSRAGYYRLLQPKKHEFASRQMAGESNNASSSGVTASSAGA